MEHESMDKYGTWNIMTMLKPGKMNETAEQMLSTQIHIIALQEIRWQGHGQIKKNKYSPYYSCSPQKDGITWKWIYGEKRS